ncbi:MAG: hypothetical protein GY804_12555 [Alphaproteobacteria bacterium]|nr:hypothetical protein [Alphaproteobacteria bacterium]
MDITTTKTHKTAIDLCIYEAKKMRASIMEPKADISLDVQANGKKYPFQRVWDNQIENPIKEGKKPTIENLSSFYSAAIAVIYKGALGLKTAKEASEKAEKNGHSLGIDSKKDGIRQIDVATDALLETAIDVLEKTSNDQDTHKTKQIDKFVELSQALAGVARLGLAISIIKKIEKKDLSKSIIADAFLKPETHIADIKKIKGLLGEAFPEEENAIEITQTSGLYKALDYKTKKLVNEAIGNNEEGTTRDRAELERLVAGESGYKIGGIHPLTMTTLSPKTTSTSPKFMGGKIRNRCGIQAGVGIIRNNDVTVGIPLSGMLNFIMQIENARKTFGFEGRSSIITSQPHDELAENLGQKAADREEKVFNFVSNLLSNLPGNLPKYYQVFKKADLVGREDFTPLSQTDFSNDELQQLNQVVPEDKSIAYFFMESAMIALLKKEYNDTVKVSWNNGGKGCTEQNFDQFHETLKNITTNDSGMDYIYFHAPKTFKGTTIAPYAVSAEEAEDIMLVEDFKHPTLSYADTSIAIDHFAAEDEKEKKFLSSYTENGYFGIKLAHIMHKYGQKKKGQDAINEMLTTVRNMRLITGDLDIDLPEEQDGVSADPKDFENTHNFICKNMIYI